MPKRVIDFDAMWASDKLASCAEWAQAEYAWFYGVADASGSFELTNLRVIWGRVAAVRRNLTLERVTEIFEEFMKQGLLFTWQQNGKRYGHWTGSDVPGRLPPPSWRMRLERLAPPVPRDKLAQYAAGHGGCTESFASAASERSTDDAVICDDDSNQKSVLADEQNPVESKEQLPLKLSLEAPQTQEWGWDLEWKGSGKQAGVCAASPSNLESEALPRQSIVEEMLAIYEAERGPLPPAESSNADIRRLCMKQIAAGLTLRDFREAVRRAAASPFLAGGGGRGWCASFDWLVANDSNVRKVLEGRYETPTQRVAPQPRAGWISRTGNSGVSEARVGTGPVAAAVGARVKSATLERIRAREELRNQNREKEKAS